MKTTQQPQIRPYTDNAPLPPPGYLAATSRGVTRYIPRGDDQRRPPALTGDVLPPLDPQPARVPVQTIQQVATSHKDRAKGFNKTTIPLAAVAGLVALLAAITLADVPSLSWSALLILFGVIPRRLAGCRLRSGTTLASRRTAPYDPGHPPRPTATSATSSAPASTAWPHGRIEAQDDDDENHHLRL
jgi:hypothetical protein